MPPRVLLDTGKATTTEANNGWTATRFGTQ